ncbi:hypothetical protein HPB50_026440 [Hyalomma asiaticum]|uniref:Uncharacterized protein n=1 Tax=Hyalomma asiaticum TaxID=266040 RepID=A0ACB7T277_HYAAI|nr:hypothetical protein HPB50_026440 [Hyalomma asiaticum]
MACLQQTVTTAPAPAATAASAVDQGNATSTQLANALDSERDSMEYQDADARVQVSDPGTKTPMQGRARNPVGDEDGWQMVLTLCQKKALAQGKKLKNSVDDGEGKARQPQQTKPTTNAGRKHMKDPQVDHDCRPACASYGGDHLTGDNECKRRLKPQVRPRTKTPSKNPWKNAPKLLPPRPRWLSSDDSEDEDDESPSLPREVETKPRGRSRSRSRPKTPSPAKSKRSKGTSRSRSRSRSRRRDADINMLPPKLHSPQLNLRPRAPGNKAESTDHTKVNWVGTVKPEAPITSHPEYQRVLAEIAC